MKKIKTRIATVIEKNEEKGRNSREVTLCVTIWYDNMAVCIVISNKPPPPHFEFTKSGSKMVVTINHWPLRYGESRNSL